MNRYKLFYPNRDSNAPKEAPEYRDPGLPPGDVVGDRHDSRNCDDYTQARNLGRIFSNDQKNRTAQAIAGAISGVR